MSKYGEKDDYRQKASMSIKSTKSSKLAKSGKKVGQKPAWAVTEKQKEDEKENEIDDLLSFAYDLDYESYIEDFEVR